jgi:enterochelin esterase-like enzyme
MTAPNTTALQIPDYLSPEITADNRVILRYLHPAAGTVWCEAEWNDWNPVPLSAGPGGLWSYTSQPLAADIYEYALFADGARVIDHQNPNTKNRFTALARVPGSGLWETRDVPHGAVHVHWYHSAVTGSARRIHIYTPPGYESDTTSQYPVLYLLHGAGDDDEGWVRSGRANFILDNLLAAGSIRPMIVAMPNGHVLGANWKEDRGTKISTFTADFFEHVMPETERLYRISGQRSSRAMAGLSMGGGQTIAAGLSRPAAFGAFGLFSSGLWPEVTPILESSLPALRENLPSLLWIGMGTRDFLYGHCNLLRHTLELARIPFTYHEDDTTHSWRTWRDYLARFAPLLFPIP